MEKKRNSQFELLRIIGMTLIICGHWFANSFVCDWKGNYFAPDILGGDCPKTRT